jgi:hypothetical protein
MIEPTADVSRGSALRLTADPLARCADVSDRAHATF